MFVEEVFPWTPESSVRPHKGRLMSGAGLEKSRLVGLLQPWQKGNWAAAAPRAGRFPSGPPRAPSLSRCLGSIRAHMGQKCPALLHWGLLALLSQSAHLIVTSVKRQLMKHWAFLNLRSAVCLAACLACHMKRANHNSSKINTRDVKSVFINHCVLSCTWSIIWGNLAEYYKNKASFFSFKPSPPISVPKKTWWNAAWCYAAPTSNHDS